MKLAIVSNGIQLSPILYDSTAVPVAKYIYF